jgi:hypothetical protein
VIGALLVVAVAVLAQAGGDAPEPDGSPTPGTPGPTEPAPGPAGDSPAGQETEAAPAPLLAELEWQRAPNAERCISRDELARRTEEVLHRPVWSGDGAPALRVRGGIARDARGRWVASLALETSDGRSLGTRELTGDGSDCRALDESLSVVLSLMVDVDRARLATAAPPPAPPPPPPAPPEVLQTEARPPEPPAAERWGFTLGASGVFGPGLLPGAALGVQAAVGWQPPRLPVFELYGAWWAPVTAHRGSLGAEVQAWVVGLETCTFRIEGARFAIEACAAAEAGAYGARPSGLDVPAAATGPLAEILVGPRVQARLGRGFAARFGLYGVRVIARTRLVVSNDGVDELLFQSAQVSPRLGLELVWGTP